MSINIPKLQMLDIEAIENIKSEAIEIISSKGILIENKDCLEIFLEHGIQSNDGWVLIPKDLIMKSIKSAPKSIILYDREGKKVVDLSGDNICFDPGSTALTILDFDENQVRPPNTEDYVKYVKVIEQLEYIKVQSTAMICSDVPTEISDIYRLYLSLLYSSKPIITGTFYKESFAVMKKLLVNARGDEENLRNKPLAIFDACTTSPLRWSDLTCQSVIDSARSSIPSQIISMPMMGATAPASIYSTIVQHTAEVMSGVVISQISKSKAPVIWGGSASVFDMRKGTTPIGAIESMMITSAYAQIAKSYNLPCHGFIGLSDAKILDMQAGFETGFGIALATLAKINMISGAGMIDFESCFSIEKLIIDNDIIGGALRLNTGIQKYDNINTQDVLSDYEEKKQLLTHPSTRENYRSEFFYPSAVIDRGTRENWSGLQVHEKANNQLIKYLQSYRNSIDQKKRNKIIQIMNSHQKNLPKLPNN